MRTRAALATLATAVLLAGCASPPPQAPQASASASTEPRPSASAEASEFPGPAEPTGEVTVIAEGLEAPWSIVRLTDELLEGGSTLVSERDTSAVQEITTDGTVREVGAIEGVAPGGEGGLLGLATLRQGDTVWLYAYFTSTADNRIVRMPLQGAAGGLTFDATESVLTGIPKADTHNGGRIAFGPDGMLYATTGDAGVPNRAQDPASLAGKILRMTPEGAAPGDNPLGSLVHSMGHRNPQGITWADDGTMYASEFGQNTWDELNIIVAGQNYGWPTVEGIANRDGFVNPITQWSTDEASPSGLTHTRETLFMAALRGARLWTIWVGPESVDAAPSLVGELGRIRDVVPGPDGSVWAITNNTDGRGDPNPGDDKLVQIQLTERTPG
jgi:glucose/arabinose dehydrogenase